MQSFSCALELLLNETAENIAIMDQRLIRLNEEENQSTVHAQAQLGLPLEIVEGPARLSLGSRSLVNPFLELRLGDGSLTHRSRHGFHLPPLTGRHIKTEL